VWVGFFGDLVDFGGGGGGGGGVCETILFLMVRVELGGSLSLIVT